MQRGVRRLIYVAECGIGLEHAFFIMTFCGCYIRLPPIQYTFCPFMEKSGWIIMAKNIWDKKNGNLVLESEEMGEVIK